MNRCILCRCQIIGHALAAVTAAGNIIGIAVAGNHCEFSILSIDGLARLVGDNKRHSLCRGDLELHLHRLDPLEMQGIRSRHGVAVLMPHLDRHILQPGIVPRRCQRDALQAVVSLFADHRVVPAADGRVRRLVREGRREGQLFHGIQDLERIFFLRRCEAADLAVCIQQVNIFAVCRAGQALQLQLAGDGDRVILVLQQRIRDLLLHPDRHLLAIAGAGQAVDQEAGLAGVADVILDLQFLCDTAFFRRRRLGLIESRHRLVILVRSRRLGVDRRQGVQRRGGIAVARCLERRIQRQRHAAGEG